MKHLNVILTLSLLFGGFGIKSQTCIDFQDTTISYTAPSTQTNFGSPWYTKNGISFSSKYYEYVTSVLGDASIEDHVSTGYVGSSGNTNYSGNIFYQGNVITQIDFSGLNYVNKQIEFDFGYLSSSVDVFEVNGIGVSNLPSGFTWNVTTLNEGYHAVLTGPVNTIEVFGFEMSIDNLCVDSLSSSTTNNCIDFQDTTISYTAPSTQTNFGSPWYTKNGISFSSKYYEYVLSLLGGASIEDHVSTGYVGSNGNTNYSGNIFYQGNVITQIDFSGLNYVNKQIEFDFGYLSSSVDVFEVNGIGVSNLPSGFTWNVTTLNEGYHAVLTGPVNTIEVFGFEMSIDNLCVDSLSSSTTNNCDDFTSSDWQISPSLYQGDTLGYSQDSTQLIMEGNNSNLGFGSPSDQYPGIGYLGTALFEFNNTNQTATFEIYGFEGQYNQMGFSVNGSTVYYMDVSFPLVVNGVTIDLDTTATNFSVWDNAFLSFSGAIDNIEVELFESGILSLCVEDNESLSNENNELSTEAFSVYPNPTMNTINISNNEDFDAVQIYSMSGELVLESNSFYYSKNQILDVSNLQKGLYLLRISLRDGTSKVSKVVKE